MSERLKKVWAKAAPIIGEVLAFAAGLVVAAILVAMVGALLYGVAWAISAGWHAGA